MPAPFICQTSDNGRVRRFHLARHEPGFGEHIYFNVKKTTVGPVAKDDEWQLVEDEAGIHLLRMRNTGNGMERG